MRPYIDLHCDTITMMRADEDLMRNRRMVSIPALQAGGALVQSFAAFVPTGLYPKPVRNALAWKRFCRIADRKDRLLEKHASELLPVRSMADIEKCRDSGRIGALFTIEDAGVVGRDPGRLEEAYRRGVRIASLIWNHENTLGYPNSAKAEMMQKGLKPFGLEMVEKMNELGIVVDVSHLSDGGFWDVAGVSKKPFLASHSNSRAMTNHPRNLTDEMIRALAESGGVMGLNFAPDFLAPCAADGRDASGEQDGTECGRSVAGKAPGEQDGTESGKKAEEKTPGDQESTARRKQIQAGAQSSPVRRNDAQTKAARVRRESRIQDMVRHVLHIRNVGGYEVLALGSDFDGISGTLEVGTPAQLPLLEDALKKAGLTERELDAMWAGNICRVFRACL